MNTAMFLPITKILQARRPQWTLIMEDDLLRVNTMQFAVQWDIIDDLLNSGDYVMSEIIMHQALGIVVCMRYTGGT